MIYVICLILLSLNSANSFPNGEMIGSSCGDLVPQHGSYSANYSDSPFGIYVENSFGNQGFLVNDRLASIYFNNNMLFF